MIPNTLTISGFDPSGGAGILADIKTFEFCKCRGFAVQTSNTIQTEDTFLEIYWIDSKIILKQLEVLLGQYKFSGVKIGLIQSISILRQVVSMLKRLQPSVKVIWDPILVSSSGFSFHSSFNFYEIEDILTQIYIITPNWDEAKYFKSEEDPISFSQKISYRTRVYLKGGHHPKTQGKDLLFIEGNFKSFNPKKTNLYPKHGSGCVFSSALTSYLSKGYTLRKSILKSKRYVEHFLSTSKGLLGIHKR